MNPLVYSVLHVLSAFLLVGIVFAACAAPKPESRKRTMALSGIAALVMVVAGVGLVHKNPAIEFGQGWVLVKLGCWLVLAGLGGMAYRMPRMGGMLALLTTAVVALALYMVYFRPL